MINKNSITATQINYYFFCKKSLWFSTKYLNTEHTSDLIAMGNIVNKIFYKDYQHQFNFGNIVIDFIDLKNMQIHEVKASKKILENHIWQTKYYLYELKRRGIIIKKAIINYPLIKKKVDVSLTYDDIFIIEKVIIDIINIVKSENPPKDVNLKNCSLCSYYDLCKI